MDARLRRIASDYEQIKKDFAGHPNIIVTPIGDEPPEKYHVTYFVNGIYLLPDGKIETLGRHEVQITLHADYPRYKPICTILTPIWHPNFRDGQICIGDIWGAGESLTDIIINIGDMIQYKSWNSYSPLSADAAAWAMDNRHLFPVGDVNLNITDYASAKDDVDIDLFSDDGAVIEDSAPQEQPEDGAVPNQYAPDQYSFDQYAPDRYNSDQYAPEQYSPDPYAPDRYPPEQTMLAQPESFNDFEITPEELEGVEYIPIAQRMQGASATAAKTVKVKINFKTVLVKGILWALIGAVLGFGLGEIIENFMPNSVTASLLGYRSLADYYEYDDKATELWDKLYDRYEAYCKKEGLDPDDNDSFSQYLDDGDAEDKQLVKDYSAAYEDSYEKLEKAYTNDFDSDEDKLTDAMERVTRTHTAIWSGLIALMIGLFLGIGEGIYYGSKEHALKYGAIGAGVSLVLGAVSGYLAQWMYATLLSNDASDIAAALVRGLGWAIMGLGIGLAIGLIKPNIKRILFCGIGGLVGAFVGGFLFNYVCDIIPNDIAARGVAIVIMGILIGVGVGLLEQFAKSAWLKVIRGEFEGKEYLVFPGTTSIGNNSKNTIVLFKDKLVGPHHCDIVMQGSKYILKDCGTPMGTVVNGMRTSQHILRQGDAISIGNSVLIFNTK